ncbi:unnamed protein product [Microthlaspi erraticum]|uniref:F-box domain-containing protein n=1 Tax=Microthlaspi erraticum TaxID=1685480 RepID=A0A6D2L2N6_9BRAS|nr:unnamed protein product [Microthlaspi erraticum]
MTRDDIPPDLEEEILSRVPAKTLSRCRSTCKRWNNLSKDETFTKTHLDRAPKQRLVLMLNEHKVSSLRFSLQYGIDNNAYTASSSITELDLNASLASSEKVDILRVFHCDGLLLCTTEEDRLVVWNPCTGETKCIEPSTNRYSKPGVSYERHSTFALGYGNNRSYKILRYRNTMRFGNNSNLRRRYCNNRELASHCYEFEIYEFSSGTWRFLEITAKSIMPSHGVSLKGNTYWITWGGDLLSFDFSTERLERMCLPFQRDNNYSCTIALSTAKDEQLSLLHQRSDTLKLEIWVTSVDKSDHENTVLSWRNFLAIDVSKLSSAHRFSSSVRKFLHRRGDESGCVL